MANQGSPLSRRFLGYAKLRSIYDMVPIGIMVTHPNGVIQHFNATLEGMLGYTYQELAETSLLELAPKEHRGPIMEALIEAQTSDRPSSVEEVQLLAMDDPFWTRVTIRAVKDHDGHPLYNFLTVQDITPELEKREALIEQTHRLQQSNKDLERFAAIASHDLQEPPRQISAFAKRALLKYREELPPKVVQYLEVIETSSDRMQTLVSDLLAYSRVERKGDPFTLVDLNETLAEVMSDLSVKIGETGAIISGTGLPTIEADPTQMRQLLLNLVSNAIKFQLKGTIPQIEIKAEVQDSCCEIIVSDNGVGFESEYNQAVFEIFRRLVGKSDYPGTGIGLALCRRIVERHKGQIKASSRPGAGSQFTVTLPLQQEALS